ncbi:MAG TPA: hypothetical protein VGF33_00305 [Caulobacteraceae bacterium]|jgi:ElaB/YqjD/DUF883 family membrane-anchored ribosome-binding protein
MNDDLKSASNDAARTISDRAGDMADKVSDRISQAGDKASAAVSKLGDQASDAYDYAAGAAKMAGEAFVPFVQQRPYLASGIAAGVGLLLGLFLAAPKIVRITTND